jgi:hypothetical protein
MIFTKFLVIFVVLVIFVKGAARDSYLSRDST